jgi:hypothetical protein
MACGKVRFYLKNKLKAKRAGVVAQVVEHKHKAPSSNSSNEKNRK